MTVAAVAYAGDNDDDVIVVVVAAAMVGTGVVDQPSYKEGDGCSVRGPGRKRCCWCCCLGSGG